MPWFNQHAHGAEDALFALLASLREQDRLACALAESPTWSGAPPRVERAALARLAPALLERVLWRLVRTPHSRSALDQLARALREGVNVRVHQADGSVLRLDAEALWHERPRAPRWELALALDQALAWPGGGILTATLVESGPERPIPRTSHAVELDVSELDPAAIELCVSTPRPGQRFHALGAPGSRRLVRYLADAGVPRERRSALPLVFLKGELVWVAGLSPCHARRIRATTRRRLCLSFDEPR